MIDTEAGELVGVESLTINGNVMTVKAHPATGGHPFTVKISVTTDGKLTSDGKSFRIENASATEYRIAIRTGGEPVIPDDDDETLKKALRGRFRVADGEERHNLRRHVCRYAREQETRAPEK